MNLQGALLRGIIYSPLHSHIGRMTLSAASRSASFALFALSVPSRSPCSSSSLVSPSRRPYWQQGVRYEINARLDESRFELAGTEMIEYVNNSPDTLTTFSLHLYLNAFRPGSRWSDADSVERRRRFNDLKDPTTRTTTFGT